jgi:hypothetical protein
MQVEGIDERMLRVDDLGSNFVAFIYKGGDEPDTSWSVDSYLLTDTDLPSALNWLSEHLPTDSCWSLGVVQEPRGPTVESELDVEWVIGADVLNVSRGKRSREEQRLAEEMLARRHRVSLA